MRTAGAIDVVASVTGDKELIANLRSIQANMQAKILRPAFRKGAQLVAREAKRRVPRRTGFLRKAIKGISARFDASALVVMNRRIANPAEMRSVDKSGGRVRRPYRPAYIAGIVEYGAPSRHVPAQPFLNPALDAKREQALEKIAAEVRKRF